MQFHLYGFIVGLAILSSYLIAEKIAIKNDFSEKLFAKVSLYILIAGVIGARLWHVATDFYLYQDNFWDIFFIWHGGLSILGAIFGSLIALFFLHKKYEFSYKLLLDSLSFSLPVGQFIGRWANFVNQELYGLPTDLPWKILISKEKRVIGFENYDYFHPLFLYEGLLVLIGLLIVYFLEKKGIFKIGEGKLFCFYLLYYLVIRLFLDFLRISKRTIFFNLGLNQLIIISILFLVFGVGKIKQCKKE